MLTIKILDNINFIIENADRRLILMLQNHLKLPVKGAFTSAAFRNKLWDGQESQLTDDGLGYVYDLLTIIDLLDKKGFGDQLQLIDNRIQLTYTLSNIDDDFLLDETGYTLYDYQLTSLNEIINRYNNAGVGGVVKLATNAGKSSVVMGVVKVFDTIHPTLTIVPNADLVTQLEKDFKKLGVNFSAIHSKHSKKKRLELINGSDHLIMTSGMFISIAESLKENYVIMVDECHRWGDKFTEVMRTTVGNSPIIIGLTATMPADEVGGKNADVFKDHLIRCFCNDDLHVVEQAELIERGISSTLLIKQVVVKHDDIDGLSIADSDWTWAKEQNYLSTHSDRADAIETYIKTLVDSLDGNTLVLCHPALGTVIAERLGYEMVHQETDTRVRKQWYDMFATNDNYTLFASFGCAGTGLSINNIQHLVFIDIGKDKTLIKQAVGRGLRLDADTNHIHIYDISANTRYSARHRKERLKIYKDEGFPFEQDAELICI